MKVFITGAAGFLGRYVCRIAEQRGHSVCALVRSEAAAAKLRSFVPSADIRIGDLRNRASLLDALSGADIVIHLAADKGGSLSAQIAGNVVLTETLLDRMKAAGVSRMVHVSTFSVYDFGAIPSSGKLDEAAPLEPAPFERQAYAQSKYFQEQLVREAIADGLKAVILRPGAVWGRGEFWDGCRARILGPVWVTSGNAIANKFVYVENCAEAIVLAAELPQLDGGVFNLVDSDTPSAGRYASALRERGIAVPFALPVPYAVLRAAAVLLGAINRRWFDDRLRLPQLLVTKELDSRLRPMRYPNDRARAGLGWTPRYGFDEAMMRSLDGSDGVRSRGQ
ncbi:MAG TPA: NAD-dependent epimerase/dehydratase family protein [Burkholderiaceae bacterium]|mgnify:CR=1 FL=1|nr:NAD-dependent epimerase/dehydratase family protein [Burkholderiaceae bacterium]